MIPIAIVGGGKIARDQHIPCIAANGEFRLAAAVTKADAVIPGVPNFRSITEMKKAVPSVTTVALCTPPPARHALALEALAMDMDVLNEKPPAETVSEAEEIAARANDAGKVLFQTWHSREAAAVAPAANWLKGRQMHRVVVTWKEDVRVWHPSQDWIWDSGFGVFDPGINALSLITHLLPRPLSLEQAELRFPANKAAPIAASLSYRDATGLPISIEFDFDQRGPQTWDIEFETDGGTLSLSMGGSRMAIDGTPAPVGEASEYMRLYRRFAELLTFRQSEADFTPFRLVADALLLGRRTIVGAFS
jgi:D-galactose 1-dehydrogenase